MRNLRVVHGSGFSMKERQDAREVSLNLAIYLESRILAFTSFFTFFRFFLSSQVIVSNLVITVYLILCQMDLQKVIVDRKLP